MQVIQKDGVPIKMWTEGVSVEDSAMQQLINVSKMPFIHKHIAVMPDVHWGMGATVGSVIATRGAIIPAAVGVDIGCGMMALKTPLNTSHIPDSLGILREWIEEAVPHGRTDGGNFNDKGSWKEPIDIARLTFLMMNIGYKKIIAKHPKIEPRKHPAHHLGTLGTGNHFIELCFDQNHDVWIMLHSGSRGIGNAIGSYFISKAKEEMERYYLDKYIPDKDLAFIVEHSEIFDDYMYAVEWAQNFAFENRVIMMNNVIEVLKRYFPAVEFNANHFETAVNCHHNYVDRENHFGSNVLVTRKGAVRARKTDLGIIPGSMGERSFIVRGKENPESFHSCSHGAGRAMGRNEAKKLFSIQDHINATHGVECRKDIDVIDETPMAYKDIKAVMKAQEDLVDIVYTLKQFLCVKG